VEDEIVLTGGEDTDGAIDFVERERLVGAGDDDGFVLLCRKSNGEKQGDGGAQTVIVTKEESGPLLRPRRHDGILLYAKREGLAHDNFTH
jgi:hypothetical protein